MIQPPDNVIAAAIAEAAKSPCQSKRGAALFTGEFFFVVAHNDQPKPFVCDGSDACRRTCSKSAVHAEQRLLIGRHRIIGCGIDMLHVKVIDGALVPSGLPSCVECSKLILASEIRYMWLYHKWGWTCYEPASFHRISMENNGLC